jgi:endonuclease-3
MPIDLPRALDSLEELYGAPRPPRWTDPWLWVLWENVAYLADDERRQAAFCLLKKQVGTKAPDILAASDDDLREVCRHGIMPEVSAGKLRDCARIALEHFDGDVRQVLKWPEAKAKKALQKFPGVGAPSAEKILLLCRAVPVLALDSNGLRVLVRLGFGEEKKNYAATYRFVQAAAAAELDADCEALIRAHHLLRAHGQARCKNKDPLCGQCPLAPDCAFFRETARRHVAL